MIDACALTTTLSTVMGAENALPIVRQMPKRPHVFVTVQTIFISLVIMFVKHVLQDSSQMLLEPNVSVLKILLIKMEFAYPTAQAKKFMYQLIAPAYVHLIIFF